ncbi:hypothetical protein BC827DRAFT_830230 [Russula dissimulans]|nr:hypothetical protein BC827DRAFT_830230 [Russula dissimulans]
MEKRVRTRNEERDGARHVDHNDLGLYVTDSEGHMRCSVRWINRRPTPQTLRSPSGTENTVPIDMVLAPARGFLLYYIPSLRVLSTTICLSSTMSPLQSRPSHEPQHLKTDNKPHGTSIHILDDDSLLNIFRLYRPPLVDKNETREYVIMEGGQWNRERWWYKLVHVCKRWRFLILQPVSHLEICLVCTYGTPVAKMLAHSPSLPIIIDFLDTDRPATKKDDQGIMLALKQHRDRIRRIGLRTQIVETVTAALDDKFPMLEHLVLIPPETQDVGLEFPKTFQAPRLRHLIIAEFNFPRRSPLLLIQVLNPRPAGGIYSADFQYPRPNILCRDQSHSFH